MPTTAAPKIAFILLAHHAPSQVAELANCLVNAASDAQVWIHWDLNASTEIPAEIAALAEADGRIRMVRDRAKCEWGKFGLVEGPVNALAEIRKSDFDPDVALLLSGSCLPCRPIAELERFLAERPGQDFIEDHDDSWIVDGWRKERWQYRHWFQHQKHPRLEHWSFKVQKALGLKRSFPKRLEPRFGSQWWALSWATVEAVLDDIAADPKSYHFFKNVWIPDEIALPTYVHKLGKPAGFNLTHFQFTDRGKPVVYYDDHVDYVPTLDFFFARKIAPQAHRLRQTLLEVAAAPDTMRDLGATGARRNDYKLTVQAQTFYPEPGHVYYRDQHSDMPAGILARARDPYVVLLGPTSVTATLAERLDLPSFTVLGEIFCKEEVDLGGAVVAGIDRDATSMRDLDPASYLVRVRRRCLGVPVLRWGLRDSPELLESVLRDPSALVIAAVPWPGEKRASETLTHLAAAASSHLPARFDAPGVDQHRRERAWIDRAIWDMPTKVGNCHAWLAGVLFDDEADTEWIRCDLLTAAWGLGRRRAQSFEAVAGLFDRPGADAARIEMLETTVAESSFAAFPWFGELEEAVRAHVIEANDGIRPFPRELADAIEREMGVYR